jgi:hypothetical protein
MTKNENVKSKRRKKEMNKYFNRMFTGTGLFITMAIIFLVGFACHIFGWGASADAAPLVFFGMAVLTQGNTLQDILKWEESSMYSREVVTIKAGENLALGTVIGKITKGAAPTTGIAGSNTGSGTCTGVTRGSKTKVGVYTLSALSATLFTVRDPDGLGLPDARVGTAYVNDNLNFTLNDGSPDFSAGDTFTITIPAGSGQVVAVESAAVDGSQDAYGFVIAAYDATNGAMEGVAIVREAAIVAADLVWPDESPLPSAGWLAQLAAKGIIERTEA